MLFPRKAGTFNSLYHKLEHGTKSIECIENSCDLDI